MRIILPDGTTAYRRFGRWWLGHYYLTQDSDSDRFVDAMFAELERVRDLAWEFEQSHPEMTILPNGVSAKRTALLDFDPYVRIVREEDSD